MQTKRSFIIGEEWIYYNIFCGSKTSDKLLIQLRPIVENPIFNEKIDKWFFIRYKDPENQIRIRFHFKVEIDVQFIVLTMQQLLQSFIQDGFVWGVMVSTYNRELERYGEKTIEIAENIFFHDSLCTVKMLSILSEVENAEELRWLFCMKSVDDLFHDLEVNMETRIEVLSRFKDGLFEELGLNKDVKKNLAHKFRNKRKTINSFFDNINGNKTEKNEYYPLHEILEERSNGNKEQNLNLLTGQDQTLFITSILPGYIHMLCNRIFRTKQRAQEMVIYDFLTQFYFIQLAIERQKRKEMEA